MIVVIWIKMKYKNKKEKKPKTMKIIIEEGDK